MRDGGNLYLSFSELKLQQNFVVSIAEAGYQFPTEIQSQLIPLIASRKDVLVWSQTAAGKTGAFLIPAINYILSNPVEEKRGARILILTSRRDRVSQINYTLKRLANNHSMRFGFVVSGRPYQPQMRLMRRPLDLMIATPGRLNDLIDNNKADFSKLEMLIVDDLTTIYHKSMQDLLNKILAQTGDDCPTVAFIRDDKEVTPYVRGLFPKAKEIKIIEEEKNKGLQKKKYKQPTVNINHQSKSAKKVPSKIKVQKKIELPDIPHIVHVADDYTHKIALMDHLLDELSGKAVIVYTSTLKSAEKLLDNLANHGHVAELARNLSAKEIESFNDSILIVSDQCKVNITVDHDRCLLHFELPYSVSKYEVRLNGKRLKQDDSAIILVDGRDYNSLKTIEKMMGRELEQEVVPGLEPLKPFVSQRPSSVKQKVNKSKPLHSKQSNTKRPQDSKIKNKRRSRKGLHGRLDRGGGQHKHKPLGNNGQKNLGSDSNWQSDFVEPKERSVKAKRVVIRYKDSKKNLLK